VFIEFGYAEELREAPNFTVKSFAEAAAVILRETGAARLRHEGRGG
jgi:hypothetical protein